MTIKIKRAYEKPSSRDGLRVLIERSWPRGLGKEAAQVDHWLRELGPSAALSRWFEANPRLHAALRRRYFAELTVPAAQQALEELHSHAAQRKPITLLYASRNHDYNPAVILKELLEGRRKPPTGSGPAGAAVAVRARAARRPMP